MIDFEKLEQAMGELDEDTVMGLLNQVMDQGGEKAPEAMEACRKGMDLVGAQFEDGTYFVGDLIYAGELMTQAVDILKDGLIAGNSGSVKTRMILCTVKNDLHDIGKNIVKAMLEAGIRKQVKIIIGGAPVSESAMRLTGADEWANSPQKTIQVCRAWAQELQDRKEQDYA